jgi:hypothetical protein
MKEIEDRLRAAAQAAADTVSQGSAPPLRLPALPGSRFSLPGRLRPRAGRRMIAPVAAAAAVAAVVTVSLVVTGGELRSGPAQAPGETATSCATSSPAPSTTSSATPNAPSSATPSSTSSATPSTTPSTSTLSAVSSTMLSAPDPAAQAVLASVPPYYVVLTRPPGTEAMVRATDTGAVLATLAPPSPYGMFTAVTAAANDRTFVLAAAPSPTDRRGGDSTGLFLLCLNAAGQPTAGLTALPITAGPAAADVTGIALSPDASRLAVVVSQGNPVNSEIVVVTLATGSATEWQWPTSGWVGNWKSNGSPLSWTANGQTLAFQAWREYQTPRTTPAGASRLHKTFKVSLTTEVRLLDADGPGGSLASSTLAVEWTASSSYVLLNGNTIITPEGTTIVCVTATQSSLNRVITEQPSGVATEYSVSTGKVVGFLGVPPTASGAESTPSVSTPVQNVLWSSLTGSTLIVATSTGAGVLTGDQLTPIPGYPLLTWNAAW